MVLNPVFLFTVPSECPGAGYVKTLVVIKIAERVLPPYLAFATEELAQYRLDKTGMRRHFSIVLLDALDGGFFIEKSRQALLFASREQIDESLANPAAYSYSDLPCDVAWPKER